MKAHQLPVVVLFALLFNSSAGLVAGEKTWAGEKVMPKQQHGMFGERGSREKQFISGTMSGFYTVLEEENGWLHLQAPGRKRRKAWALKREWVLLADAPAHYAELIRADPRNAWAWRSRGAAWLQRGEVENAVKDLTEAIRLDPKYPGAYYYRSEAHRKRGAVDDAINDCTEIIRLIPGSHAGYEVRGIVRRDDKKDYEGALKDFNEAIRLATNEIATHYSHRGVVYERMKRFDKAIKEFDEAIRLDPKHAQALSHRGFVWSAKKEYDRAIKDYDEAIRLDPNFVLAFINRGNAWWAKKEYDRAIKDYDEAIRLDPKYALAFINRGDAWRAKKEYDRAIKDYDEAIRLDPKAAWVFRNRGLAWYHKNEHTRAIKDFDEVIRLDPKEAYAVILGHFAARRGTDDAAARRFLNDSARNLDDKWPYPVVQFLRGKIAEPQLLKLADDDDKRTEAHCYLGLDHALKGRKDAAMTHFRWVKEHGTVTFIEYGIALAELERLEGGEKE